MEYESDVIFPLDYKYIFITSFSFLVFYLIIFILKKQARFLYKWISHNSSTSLFFLQENMSQPNTAFFPRVFGFLILVSLSLNAIEARLPFACSPSNLVTKTLPFCNGSLLADDRARDLIGRLTLQEKVALLIDNATSVPRLGIDKYEWWNEALHGVSSLGPGVKFGGTFPAATSFPQVITTAASFNVSLWLKIGEVLFFFQYNTSKKYIFYFFG